MHIKRVSIQNFVSYEKLDLPTELSKGVNLFLGANGSGKSNFLQGTLKTISLTINYSNRIRSKRFSLKEDQAREKSIPQCKQW